MGNDLVEIIPNVLFHNTKSYKIDRTSFVKLFDQSGLELN